MTQVQTPLNRLAVASGETLAWGVRTYVIGIINLTPDSFSGDGLGGDVDAAVDLALLPRRRGGHPGYRRRVDPSRTQADLPG